MDDLQLLLAGVAGHMEGEFPLVDHVCPLAVELVDDVAHGVLVARDGGGGDDHLISGLDVHLTVGGEGHPGQGGHGLALAAGGDEHQLAGLIAVDHVMMHSLFLGRDLMWFRSISTPSGMFI